MNSNDFLAEVLATFTEIEDVVVINREVKS